MPEGRRGLYWIVEEAILATPARVTRVYHRSASLLELQSTDDDDDEVQTMSEVHNAL